jgi:hypothetical protein
MNCRELLRGLKLRGGIEVWLNTRECYEWVGQ